MLLYEKRKVLTLASTGSICNSMYHYTKCQILHLETLFVKQRVWEAASLNLTPSFVKLLQRSLLLQLFPRGLSSPQRPQAMKYVWNKETTPRLSYSSQNNYTDV